MHILRRVLALASTGWQRIVEAIRAVRDGRFSERSEYGPVASATFGIERTTTAKAQP